jgi:hypothetical protein
VRERETEVEVQSWKTGRGSGPFFCSSQFWHVQQKINFGASLFRNVYNETGLETDGEALSKFAILSLIHVVCRLNPHKSRKINGAAELACC